MNLPVYKLNQPELSEDSKEKAILALEGLNDFYEFFQQINSPKYLYWNELRSKALFDDLSPEQAWFLIRQLRNFMAKKTYLKSENGEFFRWVRLPYTDQYLNQIDMHAGGNIFSKSAPHGSDQLVARGVIEEAIASSQLEGAHTTRAVAQKMLIEKREPKNESEQMILNNYRSIISIDEDYKNKELSLELIFELHKKLTDKTKAVEGQGRLRKDSDEIVVQGLIGHHRYVAHVPPNETFLKKEIQRLIDYANDKDDEGFVHPIIKAIFLHFWIGYLHPFTDGNGRLARALFYWYLLRKGYWTMMYLPISTVIKKSPAQYAMAYIYSEQDHVDLTYFYDFHMRKIMQSLSEFKEYLEHKSKEKHRWKGVLDLKLRDFPNALNQLNERQKNLLEYFLTDGNAAITANSHAEVNHISRQTAAKDLKDLEDHGLLISRREGKYIRYYASERLKA